MRILSQIISGKQNVKTAESSIAIKISKHDSEWNKMAIQVAIENEKLPSHRSCNIYTSQKHTVKNSARPKNISNNEWNKIALGLSS